MLTSAISSVLRRIFTQLAECPLAKLKRIFQPIIDGKKDSNLTEGLRLFLQVLWFIFHHIVTSDKLCGFSCLQESRGVVLWILVISVVTFVELVIVFVTK